MTTSKLPAPPAQAEDVSPRRRGTNWPGFRSLSRAMFRGFVRDRAALFFTILFPVLFLLLFGSLYKSSSTPKINVVEVGRVSVLDQARAASRQLDKVLTVTHTASLAHALNEVRQANVDAAVQQQGGRLIVHYSIANPTTAGRGQQRVLRHRAGGEPGRVASASRPTSWPPSRWRTSRSSRSST